VLSTGDELVTDDRPLRPGEIREANKDMLLALVAQAGAVPIDLGVVRDDEDQLVTSSYAPSACNAIPIEKYAMTRAGKDRCRCSVRPASATTSSTNAGGNVRVSTPTETRSDNRRSDSGFLQPARGTPPNYTTVVLTERYCA
jgi:hypothetical protein